jgi:hypothetical protein
MIKLLLAALAATVIAPTALAGDRASPAAEVVVTVTGTGALVGVGEPPNPDRIGALVYLRHDGDVAAAVGQLVAALGGAPTVRLFGTSAAPREAIEAASAAIEVAGLEAEQVDATGDGPDPGAQMTADAGGYHRRDAPGQLAQDAAAAVKVFADVASYGHGHTPPLFEPTPGGGMRQVRPAGWDQPTRAYACPFPSTPGLQGPAGMALELSLGDGRTASEEAFAGWCDGLARALATSCDPAELLDTFEAGPVELAYGDPPTAGPWWLLPDSAAPRGGSSLTVACAADALIAHRVAALHAGILLRIALVQSDLTEGCRRVVEESCK